jgi:hypothetical protein
MSLGRIGSRATVVGLGVLASLALMAAPSWAAKGGNSANAALCEPGGFAGELFAQDGSSFKNAGKCTSYAAKGGQLVGLDVVAEPAVGGQINETCTGFGLEPGSLAACGAEYGPSKFFANLPTVATDGTLSFSGPVGCEAEGVKVTSVSVGAFTAEGGIAGFSRPPPSGC